MQSDRGNNDENTMKPMSQSDGIEGDLTKEEVWIDPIYRVDKSSKIDASKLYARPGRFIGVDGPLDGAIPILEVTAENAMKALYAEKGAPYGSYHSYPKIYALGHRAVQDLFKEPVLVEEKVDGSQFSFGKFLDEEGNEYLRCRSKGAEINMIAPEGMFVNAVASVVALGPKLRLGWTYRGEYLSRPRHNVLAYNRVPNMHIILFDVSVGNENYLDRREKELEAKRLGLEVVPVIFEGVVENLEMFREFLQTDSVLGGQKIEGVVIKNYNRFGIDGKTLMGKFVSEMYKEVHAGEWKKDNPTTKDVISQVTQKYRTPARWMKAVQHLRECGELEGSPKDIGKLIAEVPKDVLEEEIESIKETLFKYAWSHIRRGLTSGLPEWYKEQLLKQQFEGTDETT